MLGETHKYRGYTIIKAASRPGYYVALKTGGYAHADSLEGAYRVINYIQGD